jgi:hypothetical protein
MAGFKSESVTGFVGIRTGAAASVTAPIFLSNSGSTMPAGRINTRRLKWIYRDIRVGTRENLPAERATAIGQNFKLVGRREW